jgi:hypothetical protein
MKDFTGVKRQGYSRAFGIAENFMAPALTNQDKPFALYNPHGPPELSAGEAWSYGHLKRGEADTIRDIDVFAASNQIFDVQPDDVPYVFDDLFIGVSL